MSIEFICKHDPSDPNHLICESKRSPAYEWVRERWRQFYCAGPTCPVHKARIHLAVDIFLVIAVAGLVVANLVFLSRGRGAARPDEVFQQLQGSSGQTCPVWCTGLSETLLRTRVSAGDTQFERCLRCAPARPAITPDFVEDYDKAGLREGSQQDSVDPRALIEGAPIFNGEDNESLLYSGQWRLFLEGEARYFSLEGEQLGRGPWPLQAGQETKIKVFLRAEVSRNFENPIVSGKLSQNVNWTGFAPQGRGLIYEPATRIVRWQMGGVDKAGNLGGRPLVAVFEVAVTPDLGQMQEDKLIIMEDLEIQAQNKLDSRKTQALAPNIILDIAP